MKGMARVGITIMRQEEIEMLSERYDLQTQQEVNLFDAVIGASLAKLHYFEWLDARDRMNRRIAGSVSADEVLHILFKPEKCSRPRRMLSLGRSVSEPVRSLGKERRIIRSCHTTISSLIRQVKRILRQSGRTGV
jgi:hypothetical protein